MTTLVASNNERRLLPAPPLVMLAALLIWGWQNDYLLFAIVMGILLELPHLINWRINFSEEDMNQIVDLSGVVFFLAVIYVFTNYGAQGIYKTLELLPFALFLALITQRYNPRNSIKTSALFISIRRLGEDAGDDVLYDVDISMPYVFICLISASAGHKHNTLFFVLTISIIAILLWRMRPKHYAVYRWLLPILLAFAIAFVTQVGIRNLHQAVESFVMTVFDHYGWHSRDPERAMTAIGALGRLKLSDNTLIRIKSEAQIETPLYLREVAYSRYEYGIWSNPSIEFDIIDKQPDRKRWQLNDGRNDSGSLDIGLYMQDQSAIIPAPASINSLFGQDLVQVETNYMGAVRIDARSGWINFRLGQTDSSRMLAAPEQIDLDIYDKYRQTFKQLATELDLYSKSPAEAVQTVQLFFAENFYYSLSQNQRYPKGQYLEKFLFENRKGHCEYFATATTLLLREAGIPARYAIGYVVSEYSAWQDTYLVRGRDAHSWVEYYLDGEWQQLDTTPAIWAPLEAQDSTLLEPIIDIFAWLRYTITSEEIEGDAESDFNVAWLLIPLALYLAWSFSRKQKVQQPGRQPEIDSDNLDGSDSPLYAVLEKLEKEKDRRKTGETLSNWLLRILPGPGSRPYRELVKLHNSYRFNPASDKRIEKQRLVDIVAKLKV